MFDSEILNLFIKTAYAGAEVAAEAGKGAETGVLGTLGINWKLFIAQLINFGIILLVLWKWVLTPVAKKLTERSERIEKAMKDASDTEKAKTEFGQWKDTEMVRVRSQASAIITAAENEAIKAKEKIITDAKMEQEKVVKQAREQIEQEKQTAVKEVKSQMADLVVLATGRIIKEKLDEKKDKELITESLKGI